MFTSFYKNQFFNKDINEYCIQSTMKSINNLIKKYTQERKCGKIIWDNRTDKLKYDSSLILFENPNPNLNNKLPYIILAISIFPFMYYFLKKKNTTE